MKDFIKLAQTNVAYNEQLKAKFHRGAASVLRKLIAKLGLAKGEYDLRHNQGGIAVSGEITLHTDRLYVQLSQSSTGLGFMWRSCKGRKDYTGGRNIWSSWDELIDLDTLASRMKQVAEGVTFQVV
jgi:hypothetical protein